MINHQIEFSVWRDRLHRNGRVQIPDFLQDDMAGKVHECLAGDVQWSIAMHGEADLVAEPGSESDRRTLAAAADKAREGYQFVYDRYLMVKALKAGGDPDYLLHALLLFLNSPPFIDFIRQLTGDATLRLVSAQATRYRPGQFLRLHDDRQEDDGRRYAFVINLSRDWEADWGGLLNFTAPDGRVVDTFVPWWNSLSLFRVPTGHFVSQVSPWALQPRLAITGWWHAAPGPPDGRP